MRRYSKAAAKIALAFCLFAAALRAFGQNSGTTETPVVAPKLAAIDPASENAKRIALLQTPVSIKFDKVWLPQLIIQIVDAHHIPLTQKSRAILAILEKKLSTEDRSASQGPDDLQITGEYKNAPLRAVLNDLCRSWGRRWRTYWVVTDSMIDIGPLDLSDEGNLIPLMTPAIRVYDVTALISASDASEKTEQLPPLIKTVLEAGQTNQLAQLLSNQAEELKRQGATDTLLSAYEPSAKLFRRESKTLLIVRHNVLSHHAIETLLDELHVAARSK